MRIAVTTPTGNVGSQLVRSLVRAGVRPVVLLRDAGKLDPELREAVEVREGDLGAPAYVLDATKGADEVVRQGILAAGLPEGAAAGMVEMTSGLRDLTPEQPRTVASTTPTTPAAWAYDTLRPALSTPART